MPVIPSVFQPIRANDYQQRPIKAYKRYRIKSTGFNTTLGYFRHSGLYSKATPHIFSNTGLGVGTLSYPINTETNTNQHVVWNTINHRYYKNHNPAQSADFLDISQQQRFIWSSASIFTYPYGAVGEKIKHELNEVEPEYIKSQKFSNPFKHIYYNILLKENLNSTESIEKFLKKFKKNINLVKGDTNKTLKHTNLNKIDFAFIDGGHSYETTYNDLSILYSSMRNKSKTIICDDYADASYITQVKRAVDNFVKEKNLNLEIIKNKFALIKT